MAAGFERDHCEAVPASKNPSGVELLTEYKFLVLRMDLPTCATFIAVRERMATKLEQTFAEHHMHGVYRDKDKKWKESKSKILIARVHLAKPVAFFSEDDEGRAKDPIVMGLHWHNVCANKQGGLAEAHEKFLTFLAQLILKEEVDILAADANMGLLVMVNTLRSCGMKVDVVAWFPWRLQDTGGHVMDSCCILFINKPCVCTLQKGLESFHARDDTGLFFEGQPQLDPEKMRIIGDLGAVMEEIRNPAFAGVKDLYWRGGFDVMDSNIHGYGFPKKNYQPKNDRVKDVLFKAFLTPSTNQGELEVLARSRGLDKASRIKHESYSAGGAVPKDYNLRVKELRLHKDKFIMGGNWNNGAHYPLCALTQSICQRSDKAQVRRNNRNGGRPAAASRMEADPQSRAASQTRSGPWDRGTWEAAREAVRGHTLDDTRDERQYPSARSCGTGRLPSERGYNRFFNNSFNDRYNDDLQASSRSGHQSTATSSRGSYPIPAPYTSWDQWPQAALRHLRK
jgi:hypothetical protein